MRASNLQRLVTGVCACIALAAAWAARPPRSPSLEGLLPERARGAYTSSESCRGCHPGPYVAWHASFHRTMTQPARPDTVLADFRDVRLEDRGQVVELSEVSGEFWAELIDPLWFQDPDPAKSATPPRIRAQVVMTTGSHHLQNYWIRRPASGPVYRDSYDNGALVSLPFVWLIEDARWIPNQDSFLTPPSEALEPPLVWNSSCHQCHSVAPVPGYRAPVFETEVAELGIACEACHGPAADHVAENRSPLRRYAAHLGERPDPSIVQPAREPRDRSVEACGQCHSFGHILDLEGWQQRGVGYRPGTPLAAKKVVLRYEDPPRSPALLAHLEREPRALEGRFWRDGTIRVAGREFNGLLESACFREGPLTCLHCHSMHGYREAADQLVPRSMDAVCLDCHAAIGADVRAHTHHEPESPGNRCVNCHMPHTTYGLFGAMRSHRIDSPSVAGSVRSGRPDACRLCHFDRSLDWTAERLSAWYGAEVPEAEYASVPAGALWALAGDAAQRAVVAWHMGWEPARATVRDDFAGAVLSVLLDDPYAAVRRVAWRALKAQPGFEDFRYDFVAPAPERARKSLEAFARAQPLGERERALFAELLSRRDDRPLRINE